MPLPEGTPLGPYVIVSPLGVGGMGEVYRARDARLGRDVAIKVLPEAMARDPEALARFEREARTIAALAHPNLLMIFDTGSERGVTFAVTELLEGSTLRDALAGGPMPTAEALAIGLQVLAGLAAAHDKGIVHRDLKPENLFVLADGHVKVLDFGLAKQVTGSLASGDGEHANNLTQTGTVVGTLGYMAPEQLVGQAVDARADVFAFGAVLYEVLAGERAFPGTTWVETSTATLARDLPPLSSAERSVSPAVEAVVRRCLARDPASRFATAREVLQALKQAESASALGEVTLTRGSQGIAMLEFDNLTGDHDFDWVGRGLPELLATALARCPDLDVYDAQRLANLLAVPSGDAPKSAPSFGLLHARGVARAIVGSILRAGGTLRIQCRIIETASGRTLHGDASKGDASEDLFELAGRLVEKLQVWLEIDLAGSSVGERWLREITTSSSDAYRLYLRGHEAMLSSRWREAAMYMEQSLELDREFLAARLDLAACCWNLGEETRTEEHLAGARALRLRATPRERLQIELIDAVITQDPLRLIRAALSVCELYPENRFFRYLLGRGHFTAGDWIRCEEVLRPLVEERWTWAWTYALAARSLEKLRRIDEALECLETGMEVTRRNPELAFVYAQMLSARGDTATARDVLTAAAGSSELGETPEFKGRIHFELGRILEAEGLSVRARREYELARAALAPGSDEANLAEEGLLRLQDPR